ncbi:unnamed protein product [Pleuronectes platessa]|uniref:Uncharacterized protein n=1 Tax=Pleuronectes platessa TaxID=8262 RepID=A0A9N7VL20_PLEPL|nr:unnamed protein product [Pleuronectes platessa]
MDADGRPSYLQGPHDDAVAQRRYSTLSVSFLNLNRAVQGETLATQWLKTCTAAISLCPHHYGENNLEWDPESTSFHQDPAAPGPSFPASHPTSQTGASRRTQSAGNVFTGNSNK